MSTLVVIAKPCVPGRVKTRLTPPLTPVQGAAVAQASLDMTIEVARRVPVDKRVLFWDGPDLPDTYCDFELLQQPDGPLDARLGYLFDHLEGRSVLLGMDTPQVVAADIATIFATEMVTPDQVWYGPAADGGYWLLGMERPNGDLIRGVPMSVDKTGAVQLARLHAAGRTISYLPELIDIDHVAELQQVAALVPASPLAALVASFDLQAQ